MSRPVSPDEYAKTISRNAHYIAVFKNHWDQTCIQTLFFQIYATVWRDAFEVYNRWPLNRLGIWWSILIRQRPGNLRYVPTIDRYFKRRRTCADASTTTIPQKKWRKIPQCPSYVDSDVYSRQYTSSSVTITTTSSTKYKNHRRSVNHSKKSSATN